MSITVSWVRYNIQMESKNLKALLQWMADDEEVGFFDLEEWKMPKTLTGQLKDLNMVLEDYDMSASFKKNKKIVDFDYEGDSWMDEFLEIYDAIAQFVDDDSRVVIYADGDLWSYSFVGDECVQQNAVGFLWSGMGDDAPKLPNKAPLDINIDTEAGTGHVSDLAEAIG